MHSTSLRKRKAIRTNYEEMGVEDYYLKFGNDYVNPHKKRLEFIPTLLKELWRVNIGHSLDLCAGSGEITSLMDCNEGCDPYTHESYRKRTGKPCMRFSFDDIFEGKLKKEYKTIFCSYALHLADKSKLPQIIYQLSCICENFIVISPTRKPHIKEEWGMTLENEAYMEGVRLRLYKTKKPIA